MPDVPEKETEGGTPPARLNPIFPQLPGLRDPEAWIKKLMAPSSTEPSTGVAPLFWPAGAAGAGGLDPGILTIGDKQYYVFEAVPFSSRVWGATAKRYLGQTSQIVLETPELTPEIFSGEVAEFIGALNEIQRILDSVKGTKQDPKILSMRADAPRVAVTWYSAPESLPTSAKVQHWNW